MLISLGWLRDYVDAPEPAAVADRLTLAGLEVERIITHAVAFEKVVVAEVTELRPLPGSTKNQIARVRTAKDHAEVVTGAWNIRVGDRVPYALPGSRLGERVIEPKTFLGFRSEGMLCSPIELGLGEEADGIMILDRGAQPGADLRELYPPDTIFELDLKSNRPDLFCHLGVAREVGALFKLALRPPEGSRRRLKSNPALVTIEAPEGCRRFVGRLITGVRVGPSPAWLQARLHACGVRPINNVVDVTNYVMLELGQPMHAFDHSRLQGGRLVVRRAHPNETLLALDGKERPLSPEFMVVADTSRAQALAGIVGGEESAVTEATTAVLLEAATWEPRRIRMTARQVGLRTEASTRFEKGLSPALSLPAVDRAAQLIHELAGGEEKDAADVYPQPLVPAEIELSAGQVERTLGLAVPTADAKDILVRLGFTVEGSGEQLAVTPPGFRLDCHIPADLVEEVGRIYGYDRIPSTLPGARTTVRDLYQQARSADVAKDVLLGCGFDEAVTNTLVGLASTTTVHLPEAPPALRIKNPLAETRDALRQSLLPGLLEALSLNVRQDQPGVGLFEVGVAFWSAGDASAFPEEPRLLAIVAHVPSSSGAAAAQELRRVQSTLRLLDERVGKGPLEFQPAPSLDGFHPGRAAALVQGGQRVGVVGELHPRVLAGFDVPGRVIAAEVIFDRFAGADPPVPQARPLPRFPGVRRDLTVVVSGRILGNDLEQVIRQLGGYTLREISMQSEYEGPQLGAGQRSLSFGLHYQADDRTLTSEEVSASYERVVQGLKERFQAEVRS
jgi:phenylalanyl-tRNA synthetase beta chain